MTGDLTVGNPGTVLWRFCLPLFGSVIFQQMYNIADRTHLPLGRSGSDYIGLVQFTAVCHHILYCLQ